jgi:hypothetical protein
MSIIVAVIINDLQGNKEMIFASDGRVLEHGTKNIRNEDLDKVKKLGPKTCLGYAGQSGGLFEDVFNAVKTKMQNMPIKDLLFVSNKLRMTILEMLESQRHKEVERQFGPLDHMFIIGGLYNRKLRINRLFSSKRFQIEKDDIVRSKNGIVRIIGSSVDTNAKINAICTEKLNRPQSFDEIVRNIRYAISKVAEQTHEINDHIFVRRLSNNFKLESYIGYK